MNFQRYLHLSNQFSPTFQVADSEIEEMFRYADADHDGRINWAEFQTMINPPKPAARPTVNPKPKKTVSIHPHTLSVTGILKQSDIIMPKPRARVGPLEMSETHISASWAQIGLAEPEVNSC